MRLIDTDKLCARLSRNATPYFTVPDIENAPTVDAVVVTRCKDCKHKGWVQEFCHGKSVDYCKIWDCALRNLEATFCSYGERKDGES